MKLFYILSFLSIACFAEDVAEFCVTFSKDCNKYNLHLINEIDIKRDSSWVYPDSVCCAYSNCEVEWNTFISLQSPRRTPFVLSGDWFRSPRGYLSSFHICAHCDSCEERRQVPALDMRFGQSFQHSQLYENACKDLKEYYGVEFAGKWKKQLNVSNIAFEKEIRAKIVGECEKPLLLAEYCIDDEFTLRKTRTLSYLPQKHLLDSFELETKGKYVYEKTMILDLQEFGKHKVMTYGEQNVCEKKHILWGGIRLPIPNKIELKRFVNNSVKIDSLYKKIFVEKWEVKYATHKKVFLDSDEYKIRIIGKCDSEQTSTEETPVDYSQHWERKLYKQDSCQIYWKKL